jgi:hypothetical protein
MDDSGKSNRDADYDALQPDEKKQLDEIAHAWVMRWLGKMGDGCAEANAELERLMTAFFAEIAEQKRCDAVAAELLSEINF